MLLCDKEIAIPQRLNFLAFMHSFLSFSGLILGLLGFLLNYHMETLVAKQWQNCM